MDNKVTGRIIKQTGGFYYLSVCGEQIESRARGKFRKDGLSPMVGDIATVELSQPGGGYLVSVEPRKNSLVRPSVANVDLMLMIISAADPPPNLTVNDRLLAVCEYKGIDAAIVITKADRDPDYAQRLVALYHSAGYKVVALNLLEDSADCLKEWLDGKLCVLAGNSGVGKSTLLNAVAPELSRQTGETSKKLGRGRHTTRTTELFSLFGGEIADTPGFSSLETVMLERIAKEQLQYCFREFSPYLGKCRFTGCSHTKEKDCAVLAAVAAGEILSSRHKSYCELYEEAKKLKDWEG